MECAQDRLALSLGQAHGRSVIWEEDNRPDAGVVGNEFSAIASESLETIQERVRLSVDAFDHPSHGAASDVVRILNGARAIDEDRTLGKLIEQRLRQRRQAGRCGYRVHVYCYAVRLVEVSSRAVMADGGHHPRNAFDCETAVPSV